VPRETIRDWRRSGRSGRVLQARVDESCPICGPAHLDEGEYAYLLGLYLGDGCLSEHRRGVFKLRISLDSRQPMIIEECARSMAIVARGRRVGRQAGRGCTIVGAYWKHWPCVFPQHGPGPKHSRRIELAPWQQQLTSAHPDRLLRGLVHSDGCRVENRVAGKTYPRYLFSNRSGDIQRLFCAACADFGVSWTQPSFKEISVAKARDVARLDVVIGPKR